MSLLLVVSILQKMSSCLTGSGGAYGLLDLEMLVKSPSLSSTASTITSHSSSSSSSSPTLSESGGNSPFAITTRKPRTPRKRPNQVYNEAAALLSTAYPKLFSAKNLAVTKPCKFTKPQSIESFFLGNSNSGSSSDLLIPLRIVVDNPGFLPHPPIVSEKTRFLPVDQPTRSSTVSESRDKMCLRSPVEVDSLENLETESMLDGEIEEGIDSIMGNSNYESRDVDNYSPYALNLCNNNNNDVSGLCYGYPIGWGMDRESYNHEWRFVRAALRHADEEDWWRYPRVDVTTPKLYKTQTEKPKKKTKKKLLEIIIAEASVPEIPAGVQQSSTREDEKPNVVNNSKPIMLKLNHDNLIAAWSDRGSPFSDEPPGNEAVAPHTLHAKLAQIDLFSGGGGGGGEREASVLRYKEKRRTRLFSKKIRYQVRKVNADQRPRMKGRFVRRPDSPF